MSIGRLSASFVQETRMSLTRSGALAAFLFASQSLIACGDSDEVVPDPGSDTSDGVTADADVEVGADVTSDDADEVGVDAAPDSGADGGSPTDTGVGDTENGDTEQGDANADATVLDDADTTTADVADAVADAVDDADADVVEPGGWFADPRWPTGVWAQESGVTSVFADGFFFADVGPAALAGEVVQVDYDASQFVLQVTESSVSPLAGRWVRVDWLLADTFEEPRQGWMCTDADGEPGLDAALALDGADATNLATGCYGLPWDPMTQRTEPPFTGNYQDEFSGFQELGLTGWRNSYDGVTFSDFSYVGWVGASYVARNADTNAFSPGRWSRFDVAADFDMFDQLWYCQTVYDGATLRDAVVAPLADATSLTTNGCGGFPWTSMLRALD